MLLKPALVQRVCAVFNFVPMKFGTVHCIGVGAGVAVGVGVGVGDAVGEGVGVGEGVELGEGEGVGVAVGAGEGVGVGVGVGVDVGVGVCDGVGEGVGETVGTRVKTFDGPVSFAPSHPTTVTAAPIKKVSVSWLQSIAIEPVRRLPTSTWLLSLAALPVPM